ncbi:hypothetical protein Peur_020982 [Populus x canadensis]
MTRPKNGYYAIVTAHLYQPTPLFPSFLSEFTTPHSFLNSGGRDLNDNKRSACISRSKKPFFSPSFNKETSRMNSPRDWTLSDSPFASSHVRVNGREMKGVSSRSTIEHYESLVSSKPRSNRRFHANIQGS